MLEKVLKEKLLFPQTPLFGRIILQELTWLVYTTEEVLWLQYIELLYPALSFSIQKQFEGDTKKATVFAIHLGSWPVLYMKNIRIFYRYLQLIFYCTHISAMLITFQQVQYL